MTDDGQNPEILMHPPPPSFINRRRYSYLFTQEKLFCIFFFFFIPYQLRFLSVPFFFLNSLPYGGKNENFFRHPRYLITMALCCYVMGAQVEILKFPRPMYKLLGDQNLVSNNIFIPFSEILRPS